MVLFSFFLGFEEPPLTTTAEKKRVRKVVTLLDYLDSPYSLNDNSGGGGFKNEKSLRELRTILQLFQSRFCSPYVLYFQE